VLFAAHCVSPTDVREDLLRDLRANSGYPADADPCNIGTTYRYVLNDIVVRQAACRKLTRGLFIQSTT
jgi:hypothetical protein